MASVETTAPAPSLLARAPSPALVIGAIASVQFGSALATTVFDRVGPAGAVLLRLVTASIVLMLLWRPAVRTRSIAGSRRRLDFVWVGLAAVGIVALMHGDVHGLNTLGVLFALIAGCMWGAYILVNARVGRAFEEGTGLAIAMCVASLLAAPVGIAEGAAKLLQAHVLLVGLGVGLLSSAIPYTLEMEALRRIATNVFGVLMSLEPAVAALAGFIVIGQGLSARELVGIALVVAASVGASQTVRRAPITV